MEKWIREVMPQVLPADWKLEERRDDGYAYRNKLTGHTVILSGEEHNEKRWLHFSIAHPRRLPSWNELVEAKEIFMGRDGKAIQVIPARKEHVNIHPNCLHLFSCLDHDPLPDFTRGSGSL